MSQQKIAFAVAAHPDDIEFMMAGTLLLLRQLGYGIHYMNIANGCCGSATHEKDEIIKIREGEAREAAEKLGATYHPPMVDDINIFYEPVLLRKLAAVVRYVRPEILLLQSPQDYMEDHVNASRLMVTAAFCRGIKNFSTDPASEPISQSMALYHALPYGLTDQLRQPIQADFFVDITSVLKKKRALLSCHRSQQQWLDDSQGLDSYLETMEAMSAEVGNQSKAFEYAEGWRRHSSLGFGPEDFDPLAEALGPKYLA